MIHSSSNNIRLKINEKEVIVSSEKTLWQLKDEVQPTADVVIYNGFPVTSDRLLEEGDEIVLIKKGKVPSSQGFECLMMSRHTPGVHRKIRKSVVGIAGVGGLGSAGAIAFARIGIATVVFVYFAV